MTDVIPCGKGASPHARHIFETLATGGAAHSEVAASWDRCVRLYRLHPGRPRPCPSGDRPRAVKAIADAQDYVAKADFELSPLAQHLGRLGLSLCVTDEAGLVVDRRQVNMDCLDDSTVPGSTWAEDVQGTNAIGLTLRTLRPTAICEGEHFLEANAEMSCVAVPLFGPTGTCKGALGAVAFRPGFVRALVPLLQSTLSMAAQLIEARWFRLTYPDAMIVSMSDNARPGVSNALLAVDGNLNVLGATRSVRCGGVTTAALRSGLHLDQIDPARRLGASSFEDAERAAIMRALSLSGHNVTAAAAELGVSRATMHRKMAAFGISRRPRVEVSNATQVPAHA